ncbi:MAG: stage II sporulation protein M [Bacteroidia bacterium]|nr:stage II sporulation protein M [Bacteroidia bacterium]
MKEITFLKQNEQKWLALEKEFAIDQAKNPKKLADQFLELTDDLAYARTHYPKSKTTEYLNGLTARIHQEIYKNKREKSSRIFDFWRFEIPYMFYKHQKKLLISLLVFLIGIAIGGVCQYNDKETVRLIIPNGDTYINERIHEIENEQAMSFYGDENPFVLFAVIPMNNIKVSFFCFAFGFLFSIGTAIFLFYNGAMVGALVMFFQQYGYLKTCLMVIMIHGTFELSAIVVAGVSGFVVGSAITNPGTLPRMQAIAQGAKDGVKIVLGLVPIFIIAGFLECFITRFYQMPRGLNWAIILLSLSVMVMYFVVYPIILNKRYNFNVDHYKDLKI